MIKIKQILKLGYTRLLLELIYYKNDSILKKLSEIKLDEVPINILKKLFSLIKTEDLNREVTNRELYEESLLDNIITSRNNLLYLKLLIDNNPGFVIGKNSRFKFIFHNLFMNYSDINNNYKIAYILLDRVKLYKQILLKKDYYGNSAIFYLKDLFKYKHNKDDNLALLYNYVLYKLKEEKNV